jgi:UDP-glucose 4-epimerase
MKIIITGGLGYIGSNIAIKLLKQNHKILIIDNLANSKKSIAKKISMIARKSFLFKNEDCKNKKKIFSIFEKFNPHLVIHLAGLKSVEESIKFPKKYYNENLKSTHVIVDAMLKYNITKLIFSSSATVYGKPKYLPVDEKHTTIPTNPYGKSKLLIEKYLKNVSSNNKNLSIVSLRYFNPVGTDKSGMLRDDPKKPNNLFPKIIQTINSKSKSLPIYGNNYKTQDGSAIRDYIHIRDLSDAHIESIKYLNKLKGFNIFNVGTGNGLSVLEIIKKFEKVNHLKININYKKKRPGDVPVIFACAKKIQKLIGWKYRYSVKNMCNIKNK